MKALTDLKETLATMFLDKNWQEQAERRIQHATTWFSLRGYKPINQLPDTSKTQLTNLMNELSTLFHVLSKN